MLRIGVIMYETSRSKGQELVAQRMVREFNHLGHSAYLITSAYNDWEPVVSEGEIEARGGYLHTFDANLGIPIIRVGSETASWPPRRILFRNFVGVLTQIVSDLKLNVLITHSTLWNGPEDTVKFVVWNRHLAGEGGQNPPILFCHMSHFQEASDERYTVEERTFREVWNRISLEEIMRLADFVIVTTPLEKEQMKALGADDNKFVLLPGGIDDEIFETVKGNGVIKQSLGLRTSVKLITFLGTVEERKNALSVIEVAKAFAQEGGVHFVIAGKLDGPYAEKVKAAAKGMDNLTLLGEITDEQKAQLIDETFVNITMSRSEALGIAQLEFMYRGVPVITSGVGGQSWVVRNGFNGIVLRGPDDVEGASEAIRSLQKNSKTRSMLSKGAIKSSSQATLSNLIAGLSKELMVKLSKEPGIAPLQEAKERLIEARVQGGKKLAVTTKRLIMSSANGGKRIISIPYTEIAGIDRLAKRPWGVLAIGLALSIVGFAAEFLAPAQLGALLEAARILPALGATGVLASALRIILPSIPLIAAGAVYLTRVRVGYIIQYGKSQKVYLGREFGRALRVADSIAEKSLISKPAEEAEAT
ncbi:MAG TPA: glycosyltransferase family 4 protein [Nitrososphaerales archaeon]|nr:glycosyltransferase family 4 protein [Nitrososphaerales archaeon]